MVPDIVREMVSKWRSAEQPSQPGISWPKHRWIASFPEHGDDFRLLQDHLDRASIRAACLESATSPEAARWAFLASMAWGYGSVGYGRWRTHRVLDVEGSDERLAEVARCLADEGSFAAYQRFTNSARLHGLGPAFGTKYLYFCPQAEGRPPALILDRIVSEWLRGIGEAKFNPVPWSLRTYKTYHGLLAGWADDLEVAPDVIEELIFVSSASGQWASG